VSRTFDNGLNDEIIKYLENAINSTINGVSYEEAFNTARKGIDQVIGKFYQ
jgi:multiple sugar transport system substrate-binding protein